MKAVNFVLLFLCLFATAVLSQTDTGIKYPHPVKYFDISFDGTPVKMAYMDVASPRPNGRSVILFHGKNFNGFYWKDVISALNAEGYRVIVPDQIGWGRSDRALIHHSFHAFADANKKLLESLKISKVSVVGHSMGGMLAARFTLMYTDAVDKLVLENPIGLEDYRRFVPWASLETMEADELKATAESYKRYQQTYYKEWKSEYQQYVDAQAADLKLPNFKRAARANAMASRMIYEQPVVYELENIAVPTLLIIGQDDRTIVGKNRLPKDVVERYGNYPMLGKIALDRIEGSKLMELEGVGHMPHVQVTERFNTAVIDFLR
jgi:pimeloyl-ACP methyl ester carboxylesterase